MANVFLGTIIAWPINFAPRGWAYCDGQLLTIATNAALFSLLNTTYGGDGIVSFGLPDLRGRVLIGSGRGPGMSSKYLGQFCGYEKTTSENILAAHIHEMPQTGMSVNLSAAPLSITPSEMTVNSSGTYGVPISSESNDPASMPVDSEHYIGTAKLNNGLPLNSYYKDNNEPTITTKPTEINVSGKVTPIISASLSGSATVIVENNLKVTETGHKDNTMPLMQPSLTLNYIICLEGEYPVRS